MFLGADWVFAGINITDRSKRKAYAPGAIGMHVIQKCQHKEFSNPYHAPGSHATLSLVMDKMDQTIPM